MEKIKIIFLGTSSFGLPAFIALMKEENFEIVLTITRPDKPSGRKQAVASSPIKIMALKNNITILQPGHIIDIREKIALVKPDLIIVAAYGQIIPEAILNIPKFGCLNLHASLLPKYRGAAPINGAILRGEEQTGVTIMKMDKELDTGPILAQISLKVDPNDTAGTLHDKLSQASPDFLIKTIKQYIEGETTPRPQDSNYASYTKTLKKSDGLIDWGKPAQDLEKFIRAMTPWPTAWTWWSGRQIKILSAQPEPLEINSYKPGKTFKYNNGFAVQCGQKAPKIKKLQL